MTTIVRQFGYAPYIQKLTWTQGQNVPVRAYLWGGGGGGGGNDSHAGGSGSGGSYTSADFTLSAGDVLEIGVGGGGNPGVSGRSGAPGGSAGASLIGSNVFDTRTHQPINYNDGQGNFYPAVPTYPFSNGAWCAFLNTYGVWISPQSAYSFLNWYQVDIPYSGYYTFTVSCDNYCNVYIKDVTSINWSSYQSSTQQSVYIPAGTHYMQLTGVNYGGPGGFAVTISGGESFSGGRGGYAGGSGSSGGGGGGGGATVLRLNGSVIAVAGGGGGGGGGGNAGAATGQSAPGSRGQASVGNDAGQNGQDKGGDGGGGGGAGGGWGGGQGGSVPGGDQGGYAGSYGGSTGSGSASSNRNPAGSGAPYYSTARAYGGVPTAGGASGWAAMEFTIGGTFVNIDGTYTTTTRTWAKANNVWKPVQATYIKQNDVWVPVLGSFAPAFGQDVNTFGVNSRPFG